MTSEPKLSFGQVEKLLTKQIKQKIAQNHLKTTRSGNKELSFLIKEIVYAPFESETEVQTVGKAIGQKIADLSQASDQQNLDAGIVRKLRFKRDWLADFDIPAALSVDNIFKKTSKSSQTGVSAPVSTAVSAVDQLTTEADTITDENPPAEDRAAVASDDSVGSEVHVEITMPKQNLENVSEAAIAPEVAAASPKSAEAEALLADESDEAQTTTLSSGSSDGSDGPPEAGLSEEMAGIEDAAEAEVIEKVNSGTGANAATAMPVDPEAAALVRGATTPNSAT